MFHKHDDRLRQLNEELLAEDEEYYEEEYEEAEDLTEEDLADLLGEEEEQGPLFCRNAANGYGRDIRNFANQYGKGSPKEFDEDIFEDDEDLEDEEFLYRDDYRRAKKNKRKAKKEAKKVAKAEKKGGIGLMILAIIELTAIIGILAWWASWVL